MHLDDGNYAVQLETYCLILNHFIVDGMRN